MTTRRAVPVRGEQHVFTTGDKAAGSAGELALHAHVPVELLALASSRGGIPTIARTPSLAARVETALQHAPNTHTLQCRDARDPWGVAPGSAGLVLTSPPYGNLKAYPETQGQLGRIADYDAFLDALGVVWRHAYDALAPGGRLVVVVGDVCRARRAHGRHHVLPLHADILEQCRSLGFDVLAPHYWVKITNATREQPGRGACFGRPYEPNGVVKTEVEYVLVFRKPGGYRHPTASARLLSVIPASSYHAWVRQVWADIPGASTRGHPAPFPVALAERVIRLYSYAGDTVLDPFVGSGTTTIAAVRCGRSSIGLDVEPAYYEFACSCVEAYGGRRPAFGEAAPRVRTAAGDHHGFRNALAALDGPVLAE